MASSIILIVSINNIDIACAVTIILQIIMVYIQYIYIYSIYIYIYIYISYIAVTMYSRDQYEIIELHEISHFIKQPCRNICLEKAL